MTLYFSTKRRKKRRGSPLEPLDIVITRIRLLVFILNQIIWTLADELDTVPDIKERI
jgi:hypothetical protein